MRNSQRAPAAAAEDPPGRAGARLATPDPGAARSGRRSRHHTQAQLPAQPAQRRDVSLMSRSMSMRSLSRP
jgi:hypothetical protein